MAFTSRVYKKDILHMLEQMQNKPKKPSLNSREVVELPTATEYRSQWAVLGITWLDSLNKDLFLARALLPEGWKSRNNPSMYSDHLNISLLDADRIPRVNMFIKTASYDSFAKVMILSEQEAEDQFKKEKAEKTLVLSKRSESWSEENPFGIFTKIEDSSCHGFFPTRAIANTAKELLENNSTEVVFILKIDSSNFDLLEGKTIKDFCV